jgi:hypothetical protein
MLPEGVSQIIRPTSSSLLWRPNDEGDAQASEAAAAHKPGPCNAQPNPVWVSCVSLSIAPFRLLVHRVGGIKWAGTVAQPRCACNLYGICGRLAPSFVPPTQVSLSRSCHNYDGRTKIESENDGWQQCLAAACSFGRRRHPTPIRELQSRDRNRLGPDRTQELLGKVWERSELVQICRGLSVKPNVHGIPGSGLGLPRSDFGSPGPGPKAYEPDLGACKGDGPVDVPSTPWMLHPLQASLHTGLSQYRAV